MTRISFRIDENILDIYGSNQAAIKVENAQLTGLMIYRQSFYCNVDRLTDHEVGMD